MTVPRAVRNPYRNGVVLAVIYWAGFVPIFFWVIMLIGGSLRFSLYPLLLFGVPWLAAGVVWNSGYPRCPSCRKSVFTFHLGDAGPMRVRTGRVWPEKICSRCGYDLTEGPPL